jgi:probable F420-dependent oxidoreductase
MKYGTRIWEVGPSSRTDTRDFAQALDGAGFDFLTTHGHVLASPAGTHPDRPTPTYAGPFHDPFVLFGYLAGLTERIRFRSSILILPLFPTALVAKQAAELSVLSGGRVEVGLGISWNPDEYAGMEQDFHVRGRRIDEQIPVLRSLWSEPFVTYSGRWHEINNLGLNTRRPEGGTIPIWMGCTTDERPLRRVGRLADGWIPLSEAPPSEEVLARLRQYVGEAGRDPGTFGLTLRLNAATADPATCVSDAKELERLGATHIAVGTPPDLPPADALSRLLDLKQVLDTEIA